MAVTNEQCSLEICRDAYIAKHYVFGRSRQSAQLDRVENHASVNSVFTVAEGEEPSAVHFHLKTWGIPNFVYLLHKPLTIIQGCVMIKPQKERRGDDR